MKKQLLDRSLISLCSIVFLLGLAGCGHSHTFAEQWRYNDTHHWHEATCEHLDNRTEYGEHTMIDGTLEEYNADVKMCSICGYTKVLSQLVNKATFDSQVNIDITNFRYSHKIVNSETKEVVSEDIEQYDGTCYVNLNGVYHIGYNIYKKSPYIDGLYEEDRPSTITVEQRIKDLYNLLSEFKNMNTEEDIDFSYFNWSDQHYLEVEAGYFIDMNKLKSNSSFKKYQWFAIRFEDGILKEIESGDINGYGYKSISTFEIGSAQIDLPWDGEAPTMEDNDSSGLYYKMIEDGTYTLYNFYDEDMDADKDYIIIADTCNGKPVTQIRDTCFQNRGIYKGGIVIPTTITKFGKLSFKFTDFRSIYYMGNSEEWNAISGLSSSGLDTVYGLNIYYYSENEPTSVGNYWHYVEGAPTVWEIN